MAKPTDFAVVRKTRKHSILITVIFLTFDRRKLFPWQECVSDFRLSSHISAHPIPVFRRSTATLFLAECHTETKVHGAIYCLVLYIVGVRTEKE